MMAKSNKNEIKVIKIFPLRKTLSTTISKDCDYASKSEF